MNYWDECIRTAFEESGIVATEQQIKEVVECVDGGFENYGQAYPTPENPLINEVKDLKKKLESEKSKVTCEECHGEGRLTTYGGSLAFNSECNKCNGHGKV